MVSNSEIENNSILQAYELSVGYKDGKQINTIAEDINFSLQKGELIGLVGANGIGKSTLLRTISGLQPPLKGNISLEGKPFNLYDTSEFAQLLSVVLTESLLSKNLTVFELVALGRHPYTNWLGQLNLTDVEKTKEAIKLTQIEHLANKKCYKLSDGQLQKVLIARALAQDTKLIVLDEPTTHLDLFHKVTILKLLKSISHSTNKSVLFSTHEIDLAIQVCDKILVMKNEKSWFDTPCNLIESGVFDDLFPKGLLEFDGSTGNFRIKKD
ncbi:ABC transporter ATP-binding protein [Aegicerativicinus sediminis]